MIRLIASDLDGTLLDEMGRLPDGIFDRIRLLKERGVHFAAASGRQYGNLRRLFFPVRDDIAYLCENGAYVVAGGQETARCFPRAMAEEIIRDILAASMEVLISVPETSYLLSSAGKAYTDDITYRLRNTVTVIDDPLPLADGFIKLSGYHPEGVADRAAPLQEKWKNRLHVDVAGAKWLDFTLENKGTGIAALCRSLGVSPDDTAAFGDQYNDLSMLQAVGHPFLMENAPAGLKAMGFPPCRSVTQIIDQILREARP
ncbi:MAG: HAD-IIB family hydrolase [Clostridia bacterium]|nr:HAD-IIB family hydrolase [Clostridia bacterium]